MPSPDTPPRKIPRRDRDRQVTRVLLITLVLNLVVAALKLLFGILAGAVSMEADGFHSTLDGASNIVGLVGLHLARKDPDPEHPYGHRKFEALASLGISLFLFLTCYKILTEVWGRLHEQHEVEATAVTFGVMLFSMAVNLFVTRYEAREGARLTSMILIADSKHTRSDVLASFGVLVSLGASLLDLAVVDLVVAVAIAGLIARSGYSVVSSAFSVLADSQAVDPEEISSIATGVEGILDAHRIRGRGLPGDIHVDLHVHVRPDMTVVEAHELAHRASDRIKQRIDGVSDVVVHIEPDDRHET